MEGMLTGLVLLALFAAAVAFAPFAYGGWRRLTSHGGDLQIWQAMTRVGVSSQQAAGEPADLARAVRRCVLCPCIEECDSWLASGKREGLGLFCPNATYFDDLKAGGDKG